MKPYETRITGITILPQGATIYSQMATRIEIEDESGGEYVVISQDSESFQGKIGITNDEWPAIRDAVEMMLAEIAKREKTA